MAGELVELTDPQYPLLTVSYPQEQFISLVGQDKRNDHLLAPEQQNDRGIRPAALSPEQGAPEDVYKRQPKPTSPPAPPLPA